MVSASKVSDDLDKYLPRHSMFKDCLESDVHHMTSQILSVLIDFIQDGAFFVPFFRSVFKYLKAITDGSRDLHFQPKFYLRITHGIGLLV